MKRFFFITGKGGVGKTSLALSWAHRLHHEGKKVLYLSLDLDQYNDALLTELQIPFQRIKIEEATIDYVEMRLKSRFIAQALVKTPFYQGVATIVPGFDNIILLGKIFELLKDPEQYIVLDGPATGHALTTIESLNTFKTIFNQGLVFDDINSMANTLFAPETTELWVIGLPEPLVLSETKDFIQTLNQKSLDHKLVINKVLSKAPEIQNDAEQAPIIAKKLELERSLLSDISQDFYRCPYVFKEGAAKVIEHLSQNLKNEAFRE